MFLTRLLTSWRKNVAIGGYIRRLPKLLARDYGASDTYTPAQIKKTIERAGLNGDYSCYALAMFSNGDDFTAYHLSVGEDCSYAGMRAEIADTHFHGNQDFSTADVAAHFSGGGHDGHAAGDGGHGGGHDGGGHSG